MKKWFIAFVAILIIVVVILLLTKCDFRKKTTVNETATNTEQATEEATTETTAPTIDIIVYKNDFINANIEFTCQIYKVTGFTDNQDAMKTSLNSIYKAHGLPVDQNSTMIDILNKYENDTTVINTIKTNSKPCETGGDPVYLK